MPTTTNKGYVTPASGGSVGVWDTALQTGVFNVIDNNLGAVTTLSLTNANVILSATQSQSAILRLTGALSGNVIITTSCVGFFTVENLTTGAFSVTLSNGVGTTYIPPQYVSRMVIADTTNGVRAVGLPPPGTWFDYGGPADSFPPSLAGEYLPLNGTDVSRATYASLFAIYGTTYGSGDGSTTFTLPDTRGRVAVGKDNMSGAATAGRITNAEVGIVGTTLGASGGVQSIALSRSQLPVAIGTATSSTTTAVTTVTGWSALTNGSGYSTIGASASGNSVGTTALQATSTTNTTITNSLGGGTHGNVQPTIICNKMVRW